VVEEIAVVELVVMAARAQVLEGVREGISGGVEAW